MPSAVTSRKQKKSPTPSRHRVSRDALNVDRLDKKSKYQDSLFLADRAGEAVSGATGRCRRSGGHRFQVLLAGGRDEVFGVSALLVLGALLDELVLQEGFDRLDLDRLRGGIAGVSRAGEGVEELDLRGRELHRGGLGLGGGLRLWRGSRRRRDGLGFDGLGSGLLGSGLGLGFRLRGRGGCLGRGGLGLGSGLRLGSLLRSRGCRLCRSGLLHGHDFQTLEKRNLGGRRSLRDRCLTPQPR